ncbi:tRNA (adenosine(37)-N6)-threonylcarbamoyltransferase complex dimerization subunit type 1 TsaB [Actinomyces haliotis]|uniref:tRNA (adenosine(37)-N6)-threonylcarbamoyltransferase complex dimerization subunit type 1 TsaB n=1 Tax=Actinomyces haliotis TaxID=1280843 RepID=UPI0018903C0A|nr:tRNA (adenosine(37)-N6)-threonylcarbamoyltransferase complex dimerization subunit type 1 TsaB [Actinomyces haliotis]
MRILSIDSSLGTQLLVCDARTGTEGRTALEVLASAEQSDSRHHAESLGPMLAGALAEPAVAEGTLELVVGATGPAPFTGLRAGLVTARTVGRARGIEVVGVPSLDAVARLALDAVAERDGQEAAASTTVLVVTDARRKEVYAARYRAKGADDVERLDDLTVLAPTDAAALGQADVVAGSGAVLYPEIAQGRETLAPVSGDARTQVRIALARRAAGEELSTEPLYLRHADVQIPTSRKRAL